MNAYETPNDFTFFFKYFIFFYSGCRKCGIDYGSSTELKLHFGAVHSRQTFECCVCNKLFIRRHGFLVHIKRFHEDVTAKSYPCPFCEQIYTNPEALNEHCGLQHREPNPICPLCSAQVKRKSNYFKENWKMKLEYTGFTSFSGLFICNTYLNFSFI